MDITTAEPPSVPNPALRHIDVQLVMHDGRQSIYLRDPLQLTDMTVVVPQVIGPILAMLDGSRSIDEARATLVVQYGLDVGREPLERLVEALDNAMLLDNDRSRRATADALAAYRAAPTRSPSLAGSGYPAEPAELGQLLDGYLASIDTDDAARPCVASAARAERSIVGVISPHIDFHRGGASYAKVWRRAAQAAADAELVVMLGTDHQGSVGSITLTRQNYETPYGTLPTATEVVDDLASALGEDLSTAGELNHRSEHSVELSAVWLHHMRQGQPVAFLPVLCGSFAGFIDGPQGPAGDPVVERFVEALSPALANRKTLVVASADLSHVGPAFGGEPVDGLEGARLRLSDSRLLAPILAGDSEQFFDAVSAIGDRTNVCGVPPIYLLLRLLSNVDGELVAYETCPADEHNTSLVSVCGVVLL